MLLRTKIYLGFNKWAERECVLIEYGLLLSAENSQSALSYF